MRVIGITGGIGSGKSRVLSFLEERFGAIVCQADRVAWELQEPGEKCYLAITAHFGTGIPPASFRRCCQSPCPGPSAGEPPPR